MVGSMIGTIANIVLDPIFISVLGQGTAGAAIATSLGNIMASAYYLWYFLKKSRVLSIHWKHFTVKEGILKRTCSSGLNGVILGQSVTDYIAVVLSIFLWRKIRRSLPSGAGAE